MTRPLSAKLVSKSSDQTRAIGRALGENVRPGDLVLLEGELGAGKTCLTQGILWGLGGTEYARSPTFVLMTQYEARLTLYHVDLYRIESAVDLAGLGLDEVISGDGVTVVEWAERAEGLFGDEGLLVRLEHAGDDTRVLRLSAKTEHYSSAIDAALSVVGA